MFQGTANDILGPDTGPHPVAIIQGTCMCIIQLYLKFIHVDLSHLVYKMYCQFRVHVHVHVPWVCCVALPCLFV